MKEKLKKEENKTQKKYRKIKEKSPTEGWLEMGEGKKEKKGEKNKGRMKEEK